MDISQLIKHKVYLLKHMATSGNLPVFLNSSKQAFPEIQGLHPEAVAWTR